MVEWEFSLNEGWHKVDSLKKLIHENKDLALESYICEPPYHHGKHQNVYEAVFSFILIKEINHDVNHDG